MVLGGLLAGAIAATVAGSSTSHLATVAGGLVSPAFAGSLEAPQRLQARTQTRLASLPRGRWLAPAATAVGPIIAPTSASDLQRLYEALDYRLASVRQGDGFVPRIYVTTLPDDLRDVREVDRRKRLFIRTVLPLVLLANEELRARRGRLVDLMDAKRAGVQPSLADQAWLDALAETYGVPPGDEEALLLRVDEVPVSLAVAQAIVESGWGSSRFAREGNALYGQRTWSDTGAAMVPRRDERVRVRRYGDLMDSVRSYMHNLNTHPAYRGLRRLRAELRAAGKRPEGARLAATLTRYAEIDDYVERLRGLMRTNRLAELERARLQTGAVAQRVLSRAGRDG